MGLGGPAPISTSSGGIATASERVRLRVVKCFVSAEAAAMFRGAIG